MEELTDEECTELVRQIAEIEPEALITKWRYLESNKDQYET